MSKRYGHGITKAEYEFLQAMRKLLTKPGRTPIKPSKRFKDKKKYNRKPKHGSKED
jgi:hypothetical protein